MKLILTKLNISVDASFLVSPDIEYRENGKLFRLNSGRGNKFKMKSLKSLLDKKNVGRGGRIDEKAVESVFFDVLGKELKNVERSDIREVKVKDKKIFVRTIHPAVASEIWRKREKIKNQINQELGKEIIETIKAK